MNYTLGLRIYHNPKCSKSRAALALLTEQGHVPEVIEYLKSPPSIGELTKLAGRLGGDVRALARTGDLEWSRTGLDADTAGDEEILAAIAAHPQLLQRPVVVRGDRAVIGRPPERVLDLLDP